jgi:GTP pyrophosphokinase
MSHRELINKAREYLLPDKVAMVEEAYNFAMKAHEGQIRRSGEPYLEHPLQVALTLAYTVDHSPGTLLLKFMSNPFDEFPS